MTKEFGICGEIGGGLFRTETSVIDQTIASGQTGTLLTIGTVGKITKLNDFASLGGSQSGISIDVDGTVVFGPAVLSGNTPAAGAGFYVSQGVAVATVDISSQGLQDITGELITFIKDGGNTVQTLNLSYSTGAAN